MNIADIKTMHNCTSCQMCASVCPKDAICIQLDEEGFYRPYVNDEKCINCSLCTKVCYKYDEKVITTKEACSHFAAYANDDTILKETTSGGIAHLLAQKLVNKGYRCVGVKYDNTSDRAVGTIAHDEAELECFKGSKYIQSLSFMAFKEVVQNNLNDKVAVFGTPCQIYCFDRYLRLRKKRDNFILIDLYCHGCPSMLIWDKYIKEIKTKINKTKFDSVNFRSKIVGWGNFYIIVVIVDGIKAFVSNRRNDDFYRLFFSDKLLNSACYDCKLRSTYAYTDIRLGDFWGKKYVTNHKGISIVSTINERGKKIFDEISSSVVATKHSFEDFVSYQSFGRDYVNDAAIRKILFHVLKNKNRPLHDVVKTYENLLPLKARFKQRMKEIVLLLPSNWISVIKDLYYKIK